MRQRKDVLTVAAILALGILLSGCPAPQQYYPPVIDASKSKSYDAPAASDSPAPVAVPVEKTPPQAANPVLDGTVVVVEEAAPRPASVPISASPAPALTPAKPQTPVSQVPAGGSYALSDTSLAAATGDAGVTRAAPISPAPAVTAVSVTDEYGQTYFPQPSASRTAQAPAALAGGMTPPSAAAPAATPVIAILAKSDPPTAAGTEPAAVAVSAIPAPAAPAPAAPAPAPVAEVEKTLEPVPPAFSSKTTIENLQKYLKENPQDQQAQLAWRLLCSVYPSDDADVDSVSLSSDQAADVEALSQTVRMLTELQKNGNAADAAQAAQALKSLDELRSKVSLHAEPIIDKVVLCSRVDGFGRYEPLAPADLESGKPQRVLVYCELKNVRSQRNENGQYITRLRAHIAFYDADYAIIGTPRNEDVIDTPSYNPRQDFFLRGDYELPKLMPGKYQAVVRIEDLIADKIARDARVEFEVKTSDSAAALSQPASLKALADQPETVLSRTQK